MPETAYNRYSTPKDPGLKPVALIPDAHLRSRFAPNGSDPSQTGPRRTCFQDLKTFSGPFTEESLWQLLWRPVKLLCLPSVLWGTLAQSVCISAMVAMTTSSASAFSITYRWSVWECGLAYIATVIGATLSIFGGGWLSDATADWLTRRNHGMREPEMRLPALAICSTLGPLGIALYGVGIEHGLHWMTPVLGIGLCKSLVVHGLKRKMSYFPSGLLSCSGFQYILIVCRGIPPAYSWRSGCCSDEL